MLVSLMCLGVYLISLSNPIRIMVIMMIKYVFYTYRGSGCRSSWTRGHGHLLSMINGVAVSTYHRGHQDTRPGHRIS